MYKLPVQPDFHAVIAAQFQACRLLVLRPDRGSGIDAAVTALADLVQIENPGVIRSRRGQRRPLDLGQAACLGFKLVCEHIRVSLAFGQARHAYGPYPNGAGVLLYGLQRLARLVGGPLRDAGSHYSFERRPGLVRIPQRDAPRHAHDRGGGFVAQLVFAQPVLHFRQRRQMRHFAHRR